MKTDRTPSIRFAAGLLLLAAPLAWGQQHTATVRQGDVARWSGVDASECGFLGMRYPAVNGTCYYPVDMDADIGVHEVAAYVDGRARLGQLTVTDRECAQMHVEVDERFVNLTGEDLERHRRERERTLAALETRSGEADFELPLGAPTPRMPRGDDDFCAVRTFNDDAAESRHTGRDYEIPLGTDVESPASGTVLLAEEHFLTGNTVFIDHGAGLISEFFHLQDIGVEEGDSVERGDAVGTIGSTGRSTGPHLHLGFRWLDQRVDPAYLLAEPQALADLGSDSGDQVARVDDEGSANGGSADDAGSEGEAAGDQDPDD